MRTNQTIPLDVTIASGASLSAAFNLNDRALIGIVPKDAWTDAVITFQLSTDGTNFYNYYDRNGNEFAAEVAADRWTYFSAADFPACQAMKIRSGTASVAVNQADDRTVKVISRHVG